MERQTHSNNMVCKIKSTHKYVCNAWCGVGKIQKKIPSIPLLSCHHAYPYLHLKKLKGIYNRSAKMNSWSNVWVRLSRSLFMPTFSDVSQSLMLACTWFFFNVLSNLMHLTSRIYYKIKYFKISLQLHVTVVRNQNNG